MKRIASTLSTVVLVLAVAVSTQIVTKPKSGSVEEELIKLENGWADAVVKLDLAFLDGIIADDYVQSNWDATMAAKADILASLKSKEDVITSAVGDDYKVRVYGDAAVVTGRWTAKETLKGKDISGQYRWTDVWVKDYSGRWRCVATHVSMIAQK